MCQCAAWARPCLHDLWAMPLEEQWKVRKYEAWGHNRFIQLQEENAAPDFPKCGRFYLLKRMRTGETIVIDPLRPWNDATIFVDFDENKARRFCAELTKQEAKEKAA